MSHQTANPRAIVEAMAAVIDPAVIEIVGDNDRFDVTIADATITIGVERPHAFERLATAIEARIAFERAASMIVAAGEVGVPLWLVSGSSILSKWLAWSHTDRILGSALTMTSDAGVAPIVGRLERRGRRDLGQMAATIRVSAGQAVGERIEFSHRVSAIAVLGQRATIRVRRAQLPETIVSALHSHPTRNDRWRAAEIIDHPFFVSQDLMVDDVRNDGDDVIVELESRWEPLLPVPAAAWAVVPRGADPVFPCRPTTREIEALYGLAKRGARVVQGDV